MPDKKVCYQYEFLNYYFIIKNKIDDNIKIDLEYYEKNDLIKKEYTFDNNNILKEKDGDIISKIIIGNILNNDLVGKTKDIELSKKYQILSKNTSLFIFVENETPNETLSHLEIIEQKLISDEPNKFLKKKGRRNLKKWSSSEESSEEEKKKRIKKRNKTRKKCDSDDSEDSEKDKKKRNKTRKKCDSDDSEEDKKKKLVKNFIEMIVKIARKIRKRKRRK